MTPHPSLTDPAKAQLQLGLAAQDGDWGLAQAALDAGAHPGKMDKDDCSPLGRAIHGGHLEVARLLLDQLGSLSQCENAKKLVPLASDAAAHARGMFELLIQAGVDLRTWRDHGGGVLNRAMLHQSPETLEWLIEQGAAVDTVSSDNDTPLIGVLRHKVDPERAVLILEILLRHGADPGYRNRGGECAMIYAARRGNLGAFELLAAHGEDLLQRTKFGGNLAHYLCGERAGGDPDEQQADMQARAAILTRLLDAGLDVNDCQNSYQTTALHSAAIAGSVPLLDLLHARGARVDAPDDAGATPLHWAVHGKSVEAARWMLEHGANPEAHDQYGRTPAEAADGEEAQALFRHLVHEFQLERSVPGAPARMKGRL